MTAAGRTGAAPRLVRTQAQSFGVNLVASALLAAQNLAVLFVLRRSELGLLGIASGIGSIALVAQYFGIGAAALKEVAVAPDRETAFARMVAGLVLRLALSLPIAVALLSLAGWLAGSVYGYPALATPIRLFAAIIVLYGFVDIYSYTLQGLHDWRRYFAVKLVAAAVQLPLVIGATAAWGVDGYFWGNTAAAVAALLIGLAGVLAAFGGGQPLPGVPALRKIMRSMAHLSIAAYVAKILQVVVLQAPVLVAGYVLSAAATGDVKFALTIAGLLATVLGAANTINMAVFSRRFASREPGFWQGAGRQIGGYAVVVGLAGAVAGLLAPDVVSVVAGGEYRHALDATVFAIAGAALYGFGGIAVSTVYVPVGMYGRFMAVYAVAGAAVIAACALAVAGDGGVAVYGLALLAGSGAGVLVILLDPALRGKLAPRELALMAGLLLVGMVPVLQPPGAVRYVLLAGLAAYAAFAGIRLSGRGASAAAT